MRTPNTIIAPLLALLLGGGASTAWAVPDFTIAAADGETPEFIAHDGLFKLHVGGDFGGCTFVVEVKVDDSPEEFDPIEGASFATGPRTRIIYVPRGSTVRGRAHTCSGTPDLKGLIGF